MEHIYRDIAGVNILEVTNADVCVVVHAGVLRKAADHDNFVSSRCQRQQKRLEDGEVTGGHSRSHGKNPTTRIGTTQ